MRRKQQQTESAARPAAQSGEGHFKLAVGVAFSGPGGGGCRFRRRSFRKAQTAIEAEITKVEALGNHGQRDHQNKRGGCAVRWPCTWAAMALASLVTVVVETPPVATEQVSSQLVYSETTISFIFCTGHI
jgi:hypothetical protein